MVLREGCSLVVFTIVLSLRAILRHARRSIAPIFNAELGSKNAK
jgi:hypothetical protein